MERPLAGTIAGPWLTDVKALVDMLVSEDQALRDLRAKNAPTAVFYDQQDAWTAASPNGGIYTIDQARVGQQFFSGLLVVFGSTSGTGRYMITPQIVTPTLGFPITSGATFIFQSGHEQIRNFSLTPTLAQTLVFSRVLFR
jgi:hypothetical protein